MRVTVVGAGYVGLVTGVSLARHGHQVTLVERDADRRAALSAGRMPIVEPGLPEAFAEAQERIEVAQALEPADADLVFVAGGTPVGEGGRSDLGQLQDVCEALRVWPDADVCIRSTLPPGTSIRLPALLGRPDGRRISTNPEFLRQGNAVDDVEKPTRIVIGRYDETEQDHLDRVEALYAGIDAPRLVVGVAAAELIKNVANAYLALKLSFVNEVASLSEEYGVDVDDVLAGIALDPRIGNVYMRPGLGFGGSCLPKELEVVANAGRRQGLAMHIARAAATVNVDQQARFTRRLLSELGPGPHRVALLGLSFKAGTDDLRGSPAIAVARLLLEAGAEVVAHDPVVSATSAAAEVSGLRCAPTIEEAVRSADAIVIATEWPLYRDIAWPALRALVRRALVYDGRNLLRPGAVTAAGFSYRGIGRRAAEPEPTTEIDPLALAR